MKITKKPNNNRDVVKINENFYGNSTTFIDTTGEYGEEYMGNKDFVFGEESLEFSGDFTKARAGSDYKSTDRKSTRLNSSHVAISYAVFCLKKKKINTNTS